MSFSIFLAASMAQPATVAPPAQPPSLPTPKAGEYVTKLDALYNAHRHAELAQALFRPESAEQAGTALDWLALQWRTDGGTFIGHAYSQMLQQFAKAAPPPAADGLRGTALAAMANAILTAQIDARQCEDRTARSHKAQQLLSEYSRSELRKIPIDERRKAAWIALKIEEMTWAARQSADNTAYLCAGGMTAMMAGLKDGTSTEREPGEGEIGRQIQVTPPKDFKHARRENSEWLVEAEALRKDRAKALAMLLDIDTFPTDDEFRALIKR